MAGNAPANRLAKKFGVKTGMACFEAARLCPKGVLCRPQYDAYRRLSQAMFRILEEYSPTLVPVSIDEGFLDFTTMDAHVWRNTTPAAYLRDIGERIRRDIRLPVSGGLTNSSRLAKLATDAAKPPSTGEVDFTFTVTRTGSTIGAVSVNWAVTGSGGNPATGADFVGGSFPSGTLTIAEIGRAHV